MKFITPTVEKKSTGQIITTGFKLNHYVEVDWSLTDIIEQKSRNGEFYPFQLQWKKKTKYFELYKVVQWRNPNE